MLGTARTLRAHLVTLPSQASVAQRGYRPSDDAQEADCRRFTGQLSILHSATSSQFGNDSWQQQSTDTNACSCIASAVIQPTHPPGIKGDTGNGAQRLSRLREQGGGRAWPANAIRLDRVRCLLVLSHAYLNVDRAACAHSIHMYP